jgi:hypothetical protein
VSTALYLAAMLAVVAGVAHSYLGERYILSGLLRSPAVAKLFGHWDFTARTLRLAWHVTSVAWFGFATILLLLAHPPVAAQVLGRVVGATFIATSLIVLVGSRGRHLAWPLFLVVGIIACAAGN